MTPFVYPQLFKKKKFTSAQVLYRRRRRRRHCHPAIVITIWILGRCRSVYWAKPQNRNSIHAWAETTSSI